MVHARYKRLVKKRNSLTLVGMTPGFWSLSGPHAGLPWSEKNLGKTIISQGQRKVREFCKRSGKILEVVRVRELFLLLLWTKSCEKHKEVENEEKQCKGGCFFFTYSPNARSVKTQGILLVFSWVAIQTCGPSALHCRDNSLIFSVV